MRDWEVERQEHLRKCYQLNMAICEADALAEILQGLPPNNNWTEDNLTGLRDALHGMKWGNGEPWEKNVEDAKHFADGLSSEPYEGHNNRSLMGLVLCKLIEDIDPRSRHELRKALRQRTAVV